MKIKYLSTFLCIIIFSIVFAQDCANDTEVRLWGACYNIEETTLSLQDSNLSGEIPSDINLLINLEFLDLRNNNLTKFESDINLPELKYLYLSNNNFENFQESIYDLPNLQELWISNNYINSIPEVAQTCSFFSGLLSYNIDGNYICDADILDCLNYSGQNTIDCCGESIGNDYVNYFGECYFESDLNIINEIDALYIDVIWNNNDKVSSLDLSNNSLVEIPPDIWSLDELEALYLSNNVITQFPYNELNNSPAIQTIDLSYNTITVLDIDFCNSYDFIDINLTNNMICNSDLICIESSNQNCSIHGCIDSNACNYNDEADLDDGSCYFANGDFNNDDVIDIIDIIQYLDYILDQSSYASDLCKIDTNNDGLINILDMGSIIDFIFPGRGAEASQVQFSIDQNAVSFNSDGAINAVKIQLIFDSTEFNVENNEEALAYSSIKENNIFNAIIIAPNSNQLLTFSGDIISYNFEAINSTDYINSEVENLILSDSQYNLIPEGFLVTSIYPNPFNPSTTISLAVDFYSNVTIKIYDMNGMLVEEVLNKNLHPGVYNFQWSPKNIANGIYLVSVDNGLENIIQKITFIK